MKTTNTLLTTLTLLVSLVAHGQDEVAPVARPRGESVQRGDGQHHAVAALAVAAARLARHRAHEGAELGGV